MNNHNVPAGEGIRIIRVPFRDVERSKKLIDLLHVDPPLTMAQIGTELGVTRERVRQMVYHMRLCGIDVDTEVQRNRRQWIKELREYAKEKGYSVKRTNVLPNPP